MMTGAESDEVRSYLAAVAAALADLAPDARDELLEDLDSHLLEVLAEGGGPLGQRLGPPARYAAELRSSAGLDPAERPGGTVAHRLADAINSSDLWRRISQHSATRAVVDFVPQLRPAWWLLRAWLAVEFIVEFARWDRGYRGQPAVTMVPTVSNSKVLGVVVLAIAIPISVQLGRRSLRGVGRALIVAGNLLAAAILIPTIGAVSNVTYYASDAQAVPAQGVYNDGHLVSNIYPYDGQGRPLDHVRLYDDSGQPLNDLNNLEGEGRGGCYGDGCMAVATAAPGALGGQPLNDYPQPVTATVYGPDGNPSRVPLPRPNIAVPPLPSASRTPNLPASQSAGAPPSASTSSGASVTPSPTASTSPPSGPSVTPTRTPTPSPSPTRAG